MAISNNTNTGDSRSVTAVSISSNTWYNINHSLGNDIYLNALSVVSAYDGLKRFIILPINQSAFAIGNNSNPFINNTSIPANSYKKMIAIKGVVRNLYSSYLRGQVYYVAIVGNNTRAVHNTTTYTTSYNQEIVSDILKAFIDANIYQDIPLLQPGQCENIGNYRDIVISDDGNYLLGVGQQTHSTVSPYPALTTPINKMFAIKNIRNYSLNDDCYNNLITNTNGSAINTISTLVPIVADRFFYLKNISSQSVNDMSLINNTDYSRRVSNTYFLFKSMIYDNINQIFVLIGNNSLDEATNIYHTSYDGIQWTPRTFPLTVKWKKVISSKGRIMVISETGNFVLVSDSGNQGSWSIQYPFGNNWAYPIVDIAGI